MEKGCALISELALEVYQIGAFLAPFMPATSVLVQRAVIENKKPDNLFPRL